MSKEEKKITLIFGKRGSGKSFLAKSLIRNERRLVVYDTLHEFDDGVIFDHTGDFLTFWRRVYRGNFRLVYRPTNPIEEFPKIAALVWQLGNVSFYIEEIDTFMSPYQISPEFCNLIQRGRHKNIALIGVTQRPFGIHRLLTSQAKEIYVFNTNEPRDRDYLKDLLGQNVIPLLESLEKYECLRWQDGQESITKTKAGTSGICDGQDETGSPGQAECL